MIARRLIVGASKFKDNESLEENRISCVRLDAAAVAHLGSGHHLTSFEGLRHNQPADVVKLTSLLFLSTHQRTCCCLNWQ